MVGARDSTLGLGVEASSHDEARSVGIRGRAMARLDAGETVRGVAEALSVAPSSVVKWSLSRRATWSAAPGKTGGHVPRKIKVDLHRFCSGQGLMSSGLPFEGHGGFPAEG